MAIRRASFAVLALCIAGRSFAIEPLESIPAEMCLPEAALTAASLDSSKRDADFSPRALALSKESLDILAKYPGHEKELVMNFLSPSDNVRMTEVLAQIGQLNLYSLAEERAGRDVDVMTEMIILAQAAREGKTDLMARALATFKADEEKKPRTGGTEEAAVIYVVLMRHIFKDAPDPPPPASLTVCSLDLAFSKEDDRAFATVQSMVQHDPEFADLVRIRQKYHVPDGQAPDARAMPAAEGKYAADLQATVGSRIQRARDYHADLMNLRRLAAMSKLKYEQQRDDLIHVGGGDDKNSLAAMNALDAEKYKALPPDSQKMWNLWERIDTEVPTMRIRMIRQQQSQTAAH